MKQEYEIWKKEVDNKLQTWLKLINENDKAKELTNGFLIWYSNIIFNPKIMMIGINPNCGSLNGLQSIHLDEDSKLIYFYDFSGKLGQQTTRIFKDAELEKIFETSTIKTNFFYLATNKADEIYKCVQFLGDKFSIEFYHQSAIWTKRLVEIVKPEYLVCEGMQSYDKVVELYKAKTIKTEKKGRNRSVSYSIYDDNKILIGYGRDAFSNILDTNAVSNLLKEIIKK